MHLVCVVVQVPTWAAVIIGMIGGCIYRGTSTLVLEILRIDDPLDAFAVRYLLRSTY